MGTTNSFKSASGLRTWPAAEDLAPDDLPHGPGPFEVTQADGGRGITHVRCLAGFDRTPGSRAIAFATWLLVFLGAGLMVVARCGPDEWEICVRTPELAMEHQGEAVLPVCFRAASELRALAGETEAGP